MMMVKNKQRFLIFGILILCSLFFSGCTNDLSGKAIMSNNSLISYYDFDETAEDTINGLNGEQVGAEFTDDGAVHFDANSYIKVPKYPLLTKEGTVYFKFKIDESSEKGHNTIFRINGRTGQRFFAAYNADYNYFYVDSYPNPRFYIKRVEKGKWHEVIYSWDVESSKQSLWFDGESQGDKKYINELDQLYERDLYFGVSGVYRGVIANPLKGNIDEFKIYGEYKTYDDINTMYIGNSDSHISRSNSSLMKYSCKDGFSGYAVNPSWLIISDNIADADKGQLVAEVNGEFNINLNDFEQVRPFKTEKNYWVGLWDSVTNDYVHLSNKTYLWGYIIEETKEDCRFLSDYLPEIQINSVSDEMMLDITTRKSLWTEHSPIVLNNDDFDGRYIFGSNTAFACDVGENIYDKDEHHFTLDDCSLLTKPEVYKTGIYMDGFVPVDELNEKYENNEDEYWKRAYIVPKGVEVIGNKVYFFNHGENLEMSWNDDNCYINTLIPDDIIESCKNPGLDNFNVIVSMSSIDNDKIKHTGNYMESYDKLVDYGPIVWPLEGFLDAEGNVIDRGIDISSSIKKDGYVYLFLPSAEYVGQYVARAKINSDDTLSDFKYYAGNNQWKNALPDNFDKHNRSFFRKGLSYEPQPIISYRDTNTETYAELSGQFSVAKIKGTDYYIGVEEVVEYELISDEWVSRKKIYFRISKDLLHWSEGKIVDSLTVPGSWEAGNMRYVYLSNLEGTSNKEIDLNGFYVLGSSLEQDKPNVYKVKFSLSLT